MNNKPERIAAFEHISVSLSSLLSTKAYRICLNCRSIVLWNDCSLAHTMKSLLSLSVIVPSKSVKKMYFGFLNGQFIALSSDAEAIDGRGFELIGSARYESDS